jgi:hypothetical protein
MIVVVSPSTLSITIALLACLLLALTFSSLHLKDNLPSAADDGIKAAFVILVGPSTATENRTRGLELALHTLWFNYLQAHPQPVYLFVGDDVPPGQYTPEVIKAIAPEGMVAEAFQVPGFTRPPDNMRTVVLHHIVAGGKYPGERSCFPRQEASPCSWPLQFHLRRQDCACSPQTPQTMLLCPCSAYAR